MLFAIRVSSHCLQKYTRDKKGNASTIVDKRVKKVSKFVQKSSKPKKKLQKKYTFWGN